ncbi:MAG: DUF554 domain-containing protein [Clostridiales bacterium]|nr:DUF554 domain-containing protein [Clostridiales bacterium]
MFGLGTVINVAGVLLGGLLGALLGKKLAARFQNILSCAAGICVIFIGAGGAFSEMLTVQSETLSAGGSMMLIASVCIGAVLGELLNLEKRTEQFGSWLKARTKSDKDAGFVEGFVTASLTICIGAMAVIGPIRDGIYGDYSILLTKSILDAIIIMVLTASYGKGCVFSAIPIFIFEGLITVLAKIIQPLMTPTALSNLSFVGSVLIFCVGINLVFGKKIKVANLLPSVIIAAAWAFLPLP